MGDNATRGEPQANDPADLQSAEKPLNGHESLIRPQSCIRFAGQTLNSYVDRPSKVG